MPWILALDLPHNFTVGLCVDRPDSQVVKIDLRRTP